MNLLFRVRVWWKRLTARWWVRDSFCKRCGVDVRDFRAADGVWDQVFRLGGLHNVLCYHCFCDVCIKIDLPPVWDLVEKKYCEYCGDRFDIDSLEYPVPGELNLACPDCYNITINEITDRRLQAVEAFPGQPAYYVAGPQIGRLILAREDDGLNICPGCGQVMPAGMSCTACVTIDADRAIDAYYHRRKMDEINPKVRRPWDHGHWPTRNE